ncbi:Alpha/Beta hydrolase protein [Mycena vulgaris]|nr:Alpha/Beta hydrolase protein [Mycena vulgaris]
MRDTSDDEAVLQLAPTSPPMSDANPQAGILVRVPLMLIYVGLTYGIVVVLMFVPFVQRHLVYGHHHGLSSIPNFSAPEDFGLAQARITRRWERGSWRQSSTTAVFPSQSRRSTSAVRSKNGRRFCSCTGRRVTGPPRLRVPIYGALSARLNANVLAVDYRGFGDSTGGPTLAGIAADARAAWDELMALGAAPADVLIVGHSLGSSVAGLLAAELSQEAIRPRGLVLLAPFASVRTLMYEHYLFGFLPLLKPLVKLPPLSRFVIARLAHRFDTLSLVPRTTAPCRTRTQTRCSTRSSSRSSRSRLPQFSGMDLASQQADMRKGLVAVRDIPALGKLEETQKDGRRFALLKTFKGTHDIGRVEGVQDVMGRMFGFISVK